MFVLNGSESNLVVDKDKNAILDFKFTKNEKEAFIKYLKEVIFSPKKLEIQEITKGGFKDFISSEWGKPNENSMLWKGGIEAVQRKLGLYPSGEFDILTLKKILEFQSNNGLKVDGLIGPLTIDALNKKYPLIKDIKEIEVGKVNEVAEVDENHISENEKLNELNEVLAVFNKTEKGRTFLEYLKKYSDISIEKLSSFIFESANSFDIPYNRIISVIIGEADFKDEGNPFKANIKNENRGAKGIGQFLSPTFTDLYSKSKWDKGVAIEGNVLQYFEAKGESKYSENLKNIGINSLNDRYDPKKSIMAIGAYLRYIMMNGKGINGDVGMAVARYNLGPNGKTMQHLKNNPVVAETYENMFGNAKPTEEKVALAAKKYYSQYS